MCGHRIQLLAASYKNRILSLVAKSLNLSGGPNRARTGELFIANEVFYQLNYGPSCHGYGSKQQPVYENKGAKKTNPKQIGQRLF